MDDRQRAVQTEMAGSLTPALEGAPRSASHIHRTNEKGRVYAETGQEKKNAILLEEKQTR